MTPNCHRHAAESERNVSPTLERSSKLSSKGRSSYFLTARYRKQSTKIYTRKSYRTARQTPDSPMRATTKGFWPILRRLAGARKSSNPKRDRKLKDIQMMKKRDVPDCELDTLREKNEISGSESEYYCKESNSDWDTQSKGNGITRNITKARESPAPKLSFVQRSNFRIRLYYQLNVVKRTKEKPAKLNSLKLERLELGSYCPLKRLKGKHLGFERSKPIAMQTRRISDVEFDSRSSKLLNGEMSESDKGSDSQDVFALDIDPIERS